MSKEYKLSKSIGEIVTEEAANKGVTVPENMIEVIIYEATGYPCFWTGDPEECFRKQLSEFFEKAKITSIDKTLVSYEEETMRLMKELAESEKTL